MSTAPDPRTLTDAEKTAYIKQEITKAGARLRARHPWLKHQNLIGVAIMLFGLGGMVGSATAYGFGHIPWWLCIPLVAMFASLIHELEHDLIHLMYFRDRPAINRLMLIVGWIARPSTINPLVRRRLHLHHHKHSGTETDLEERGITNGEPWGLRRLLMTGDNMLAVMLRPRATFRMVRKYIHAQKPRDEREFRKMAWEQRLAYSPLATIYYLAWHGWLVYHGARLVALGLGFEWSVSAGVASTVAVLDFLAVVWMLPSFLRTFCLHFISSNMHYYGDVQDGNILQQTQVFNAWWLWPFQLFCFNFGSTHAIHHFVVKEPFYIRQWTAGEAHIAMRLMGVRFNDFGTFRRANRYAQATQT
ncbi:MAG: fatty acid desaturase [Oceanococcaceae bacterium]